MQIPESELSTSIPDVLKIIGPESSVSAAEMARVILKLNYEYADRKLASVQLMETSLIRTASEWIGDVQNLFDLTKIHYQSEMWESESHLEEESPLEKEELCCEQEVIRVLKGGSAFSPLSADTLSKYAYMR